MKILKEIITNEIGHGQVPSTKELLKLGLVLVTFPVSVPVMIIKEKLQKKKEEKSKK